MVSIGLLFFLGLVSFGELDVGEETFLFSIVLWESAKIGSDVEFIAFFDADFLVE